MTFQHLPTYPAIEQLKQTAQWVAWKYVHRAGSEKPTKPPINAKNGFGASHSKPSDWASYDIAAKFAASREGIAGIGFVLTDTDDVTGIDIDDCIDEDGAFLDWVLPILELRETYGEVSPSGRGIRMLARGKPDRTYKSDAAGVEIYGKQRYLTITGHWIEGLPQSIEPAPGTLDALKQRIEECTPTKAPVVRPVASSSIAPTREGDDFFSQVNAVALANLARWVPVLFGSDARHYPTTGAWRVSSERLGRDLQEDLSITPYGIRDFGVADMGDRQAGGRTCVDLVLEYRGSTPKDAAIWLCATIGVSPESLGWTDTDMPSLAHADAVVAKLLRRDDGVVVTPDGEEVEDPAEAAPAPVDPPLEYPEGLVGDIARWIVGTARWPQPDLAIGAALTLVGTIAGRQYVGPTRSGTHLYTIQIAETGTGKDHALKAVQKIMVDCGLSHHIGPSEFISMPAAINLVVRSPLSLCPQDEFGDFMARIGAKKASGFEKSIAKILRQMWSSSFSVYQTPEWAGKESTTIHSPALSIIGVSTPAQFWTAMEASSVEDGTLNRMLINTGAKRPPEVDPELDSFVVPTEIRTDVRAIYHRSGELASAMRNQSDADPAKSRGILEVEWTDEARDMYRAFGKRVEAMMDADPRFASFLVRTTETALRIATILCVGRQSVLKISASDMEYGTEVAMRSARFMLSGAADYISESEAQAQAQKIKRILKRHGGRAMHATLLREMGHSVRAKDLKDVMLLLVESEEMEIKEILAPGSTRGTVWYVLR